MEIVVAGEIELGQRGFIDVEINFVGSEDELKDEDSKANDDNHVDYEFQKEAKKAATAATALIVSTTVQAGLFLCHNSQKLSLVHYNNMDIW